MAFRGRKTSLAAPEQQATRRLIPYRWEGGDKKGLARWCRCHPDPEIQAAIEHSTRANLLQTIGRGRPAQRTSPLIVVIFSALPIAGLAINELTDLADILEESRITVAQRAALDAGREKGNQARVALARIKQAQQELAAQGEKYMAVGRFARYTGLERETLRWLGYEKYGRWVRMGDIRAGFSQELFIAIKIQPAKPELEYLSPESSPELRI
jgi:hypothetical protein